MKTLVLAMCLLLLLVLPPPGHGAHHRPHSPATCHVARLLPLRVVRTPGVAQQHRLVREVR